MIIMITPSQGGVKEIRKMFIISNQSRVATVVASTSEGYDIGLAKGAGFRTVGSGGAVRVGPGFFPLGHAIDD
jgi:hypothetical protein